MVGLFFQSNWKSSVTKTNIGDCISTIKKELSSIRGENSSVKKAIEKYSFDY